MKLATRFIAAASLCAYATTLSLVPGLASVSAKTKAHKNITITSTKWPQICPMTGTKIASLKDAVGESTYKGKTYYFCCPMCKPQFSKDPAKYAALAAKHKYSMSM